MKVKNVSDSKLILIISVITLGVGAFILGLFNLLDFDGEIRFYLGIGVGIGLIIFIISSIIRLKINGSIYDERDSFLEKETNAISFTIFQILLSIFILATYKMGDIKINVSAFSLLLFFIMWTVYGIVYFFVRRKN